MLSESERNALDLSLEDSGCYGFQGDHPPLYATVEKILADRIQDEITGMLHPEFGTEWREPDGLIFRAALSAKAQGWNEGWDERDNDCSEPYSPHKINPYE